ncbi:MAG: hypothetical protein OEW89_07425 [Gammaproteobacteria bacterium]|nr:hypothetical protein [Gammaproteobacteria bacterium]MDH5593522.1 hypothetical protein [Gammaproteobacteria bacterium]
MQKAPTRSYDDILCYCYDISYGKVLGEIEELGYSTSRTYVEQQTKSGDCACKTKNPSGKCCLKDFPDDRIDG